MLRWWFCGAGYSLLTGAAIARAPMVAWLATAVAGAVILLQAPPAFLIACGIVAAALSRVGVSLGLPPFLNFLHFPLVCGGAILAWIAPTPAPKTARSLARGMLLLLCVFLLSWAANGGELLRPLFDWLVYMEPFLLVYALLKAPPAPHLSNRYWGLIGLIAALQVPFGVWQVLTLGWSDFVQGTFMGQGAGAHIAGGVALLGVLICLAIAVYENYFPKKVVLLVASALLFGIRVVGDAKQAIFAFVPAFFASLLQASKIRISQLIAPLIGACCIFVAAFMVYAPLRLIMNDELISEGASGKVTGVLTVLSFMRRTPAGWLFGIGPGNSVSRVALLTSGGQVALDSPLARLGLKVAPTTDELLRAIDSDYISSSSSAFTTISSWLGLIGDCGPIALSVYLWLGWVLWGAVGSSDWRSIAAKGAILMAAILGGIYSWLEEPGFILMVGTVIGLAIIGRSRRVVAWVR